MELSIPCPARDGVKVMEETPRRPRRRLSLRVEDLIPEIERGLEGMAAGLRTTVEHAITVGRLFNKAKAGLKESKGGPFMAWVKEHFPGISHREVNRWMELARAYDAGDSTFVTNSTHSTITSVIAALRRAPSPPPRVAQEPKQKPRKPKAEEPGPINDPMRVSELMRKWLDGYDAGLSAKEASKRLDRIRSILRLLNHQVTTE
jgi:hypothetical protein